MFPEEIGIPVHLQHQSCSFFSVAPGLVVLPFPWFISTSSPERWISPQRAFSHITKHWLRAAWCAALLSEQGPPYTVPALTELAFLAFTSSISSWESTIHKSWPPAGTWPQSSSPAGASGWPNSLGLDQSFLTLPNPHLCIPIPANDTTTYPVTPAPNFSNNRNGSSTEG